MLRLRREGRSWHEALFRNFAMAASILKRTLSEPSPRAPSSFSSRFRASEGSHPLSPKTEVKHGRLLRKTVKPHLSGLRTSIVVVVLLRRLTVLPEGEEDLYRMHASKGHPLLSRAPRCRVAGTLRDFDSHR